MNKEVKKTAVGQASLKIQKKNAESYAKAIGKSVISFFVVFCTMMTVGLCENCFGGAVLFGVLGTTAVLVGFYSGVWDEQ